MKKLFSLLLAFVLLTGCSQKSVGSGDNESQEELKGEYEKIYAPVLDEVKIIVESKGTDYEEKKYANHDNVRMWASDESSEGAFVGYAIKDVIGDEKPELIIAPIIEEDNGKLYGLSISELYTIVDGEAKLFTEVETEYYDDNLFLLNDRTVYEEVSGDDATIMIMADSKDGEMAPTAIYKIFEDYETGKVVCHKDEDNVLSTPDFVDTGMKDKEIEELYGITGRAVNIELKQVVETENIIELINRLYHGSDAVLQVSEFKEDGKYPAGLKKFVVNDSEYSVKILIESGFELKDFQIIEVEPSEFQGGIEYTVKEILHDAGTVDAENPIMIQLDIPEHVSYTAFKFTDDMGAIRYFCVYESGADGSLGLEEIYPAVG